jgi:hypothetical protein
MPMPVKALARKCDEKHPALHDPRVRANPARDRVAVADKFAVGSPPRLG